MVLVVWIKRGTKCETNIDLTDCPDLNNLPNIITFIYYCWRLIRFFMNLVGAVGEGVLSILMSHELF